VGILKSLLRNTTSAAEAPVSERKTERRSVLPTKTAPEFDQLTELRHRILPYVKRMETNDVSAATKAAGGVRGSTQLFETVGSFTPITKPLFSDLQLCFGVIQAHGLELAKQHHLHEWSVSEFQLQQLATANFARLVDEKLEIQPLNNIFMFTIDGRFEASLMLTGTVWERFEAQLDEPVVVAAPARDVVLAARSSDPSAMTALRLMATQVYNRSEHRLSRFYYCRQGDGWKVVAPIG
jgi:hypothetical protein